MKVGEAIAEILKREGIAILAGYPVNHLLEFAAARDIRPVIVRQERIGHDAGSPPDQLSPFWVSTEPLTYLGWGKTTQLGYGLGLAMDAKLARPDKLCITSKETSVSRF
ncbi:MAG: hypothetical protein JO264_12980 [Acidisphaera sp.]|nr:hypothetical protein [Acidisphaera sp.]